MPQSRRAQPDHENLEIIVSQNRPRQKLSAAFVQHTVRIFHGNDLLVVVKVVQERSEDSPACIKFVVADKVGMVSLQGIQDQGLVGLGDPEVREATAIREVKFRHNRLHGQAGQLRVHLNVHALVGLHANDKLIAGDVLEDARCHVTELDTNLRLLFVES